MVTTLGPQIADQNVSVNGLLFCAEALTVQVLIDRLASVKAGAPFLLSPETKEVLSFSGLREQARSYAAAFLSAGVQPGDKIALLIDNGLFGAELFLSVIYGGFVIVPLNVRAGVSQLTYVVEHCDAKLIFVGDEYRSLIEEVLANVSRAVQILPADRSFLATETGPDVQVPMPQPEDPALLMYTSGSTGRPRAAIHCHRALLAAARNSVLSHQLKPEDRSLLVLPLYHINAECVTLMPTLLSGGSVVVPARFSVSQYWDLLDEYHCTWSAVVPTIISQLLDWEDPRADRRAEMFRRIRFLRSSSAPLAPSLHREFLCKFNVLLIQAMGSSEAGNVFSNPQAPGENKIVRPVCPGVLRQKSLTATAWNSLMGRQVKFCSAVQR